MAKKKKNEFVKNQEASRSSNAWLPVLYTALLVVAAVAVMLFSSALLPHFGLQRRGGGLPGVPQELQPNQSLFAGDYPLVRLVLSITNLVLVTYLIYVYTKNYLQLKTPFALGLVAFLFSFLLYSIATLPLFHMLLEEGNRTAFTSFVPMLFSAIALLIFVKLSNE